MQHSHGPDMQGRNVLAVHRDEAGQRPSIGEHLSLHHVIDVAQGAGSAALERFVIQPLGNIAGHMGGIALHFRRPS